MTERATLPHPFWVLFAATFVARTGFFVESFLTIFMEHDAGFAASTASLMMALYGIGGVASTLISGPLVDRFGPATIVPAALLLTGISAGTLATGPPQWLVGPIVLAVGACGQVIMPASNALVATIVPHALRRRAFSLMFVALNAGLALGPILGGWLSARSFPLMFAVGAGFVLAGGALALRVRGGRAQTRQAQHTGHESAAPAALPLLTGLAVAGRDRLFLLFVASNVLFMCAYLQVFVTLPLFIVGDGLGTQSYGLLMALNGALLVTLQLPLDRALARVPAAPLLVASAVLLALGMGLNVLSVTFLGYCTAALLWTGSELVNMPLATSTTASLAPAAHRGVYLSVHGLSFPLGMTLASLVGGGALRFLADPTHLWLIIGALGLAVAALRLALAPRLQRRLDRSADQAA